MSNYLQYNNHMILHPTDRTKYFIGIVDPLNPLMLPSYTIRLLYQDGVTPTFAKGTATQVSSSPNVWDLTYANSDWNKILSGAVDQGHPVHRDNLLKVLGANTAGVTNMYGMFSACRALNEVAPFRTSSVTNMGRMFSDCEALTTAPDFDSENVTDFRQMFVQSGITVGPHLNTRSAVYMMNMFLNCTSLTTIPLYDTSSVTNMGGMFKGCSRLASVPLMDTKNVTDFGSMFYECALLTSIPLFDTRSATTMEKTFYKCLSVSSGAFALYQQASTQAVPPSNHDGTFRQCGKLSLSGSLEVDQIPQDWGGTRVDLGSQSWMSKNLKIDDGQGGIYTQTVNYGEGNVTEYYYTLAAAIRVAATVPGWHLPSASEWDTLANTVGSSTAGTKLKSTYGWESGNGTDDYGFTALPAGRWYNTQGFSNFGTRAIFWTSSSGQLYDYNRGFDSPETMRGFDINYRNSAFTIRLIKD